ncbi:MAG: T9SS type A sorting domain-containing protein [Bacteroidetes bacterium]|jgi:hypothetical protein|nr:T9SS type A sorting domain-containing protein [Bacteroidota bacterium]
MKRFLVILTSMIIFLTVCQANIDEKDKELVVYPNPVIENIIQINSPELIQYVEVVNILGSVIYKEYLNDPSRSFQIVFKNNLDKGVYLLKAETSDQGTFIKKIMAR